MLEPWYIDWYWQQYLPDGTPVCRLVLHRTDQTGMIEAIPTRSPPNLFTPTHFLDFCPLNLYVYNLSRTLLYMPVYPPTYPNTLLATCMSAMLASMMNILSMQVLQCHIPNSLPTHPHKIQISKFIYAYVPRAYVRETLCKYCISRKH
jgi:hypothetical protein